MQCINKINFKLVDTFDEFTSAIYDDSEDDIISNPIMVHFGEDKNLPLVKNLDADVRSNLNVLAQLFPELQRSVPKITHDLNDPKKDLNDSLNNTKGVANDIKSESASHMKFGMGPNLTMQRYDPTIMESNIKDDDENISKNSDATDDAESKSSVDDATIISENEEQNDIENGEEIQNDIDNKKQIYEQTKL